jgi:hypothetical protein
MGEQFFVSSRICPYMLHIRNLNVDDVLQLLRDAKILDDLFTLLAKVSVHRKGALGICS